MKKIAWIALAGFVAAAVLIAAAFAAWLLWGLPQEIGSVSINGKVLEMEPHAGHWVLATMAVLLAGLIVLLVVATIALLVLIVPVMIVPLGLAVAALGLGIVMSPLMLLIWWLWKRADKPDTIAA